MASRWPSVALLGWALLAGCGGGAPAKAPTDGPIDVHADGAADVSAETAALPDTGLDAAGDVAPPDGARDMAAAPDAAAAGPGDGRDGPADLAPAADVADAPLADDARDAGDARDANDAASESRVDAAGTDVAEAAPSCDPPPALLVPDSEKVSQPYDVAMAQSPAGNIGVIWSRSPVGYGVQLSTYDPATRAFGPTAPIMTINPARSAGHVAMTVMPDGRLAGVWGLSGGRVEASIGFEAGRYASEIGTYINARDLAPFVGIAPVGSDRIALAWTAYATIDNVYRNVITVQVMNLALERGPELTIVPIGVGSVIPQLAWSNGQLLVFIEQGVDNGQGEEVSVAKIAASNLAITPPKHLVTATGGRFSRVIVSQAQLALAYGTATDLMLATFDLDGSPLGTPEVAMPKAGAVIGTTSLFWDGSSYHLLWYQSTPAPQYGVLKYAKLDAGHRALPPLTIGNMNVPRPVELFRASTGLVAGWFSSAGAYLSPLCP